MASITQRIKALFVREGDAGHPAPPERSLENPATPINSDYLGAVSRTKSGANVTTETALSITALWRAVQILSGVVASMPIAVYAVTDDTAERKTKHPISRLLKFPSQLYTKFDFMQTMVLHLLLHGNFYARIEGTGQTGYARSLTILAPERMKMEVNSRGQVVYIYHQESQRESRYLSDRIIHISGLSWTGALGINTTEIFRDVFGTAISSQDYMANFFGNGAMLSGVVSVPQKLDAEAYLRLRTSWSEAYAGASKAGATAILEQGAAYQKVGLSPAEAGSKDVKEITIADIARITGVPSFLLEELGRATWNNTEQITLAFVKYTLIPLCRNVEDELSRKLLQEPELMTHEIRLDINSLVSADAKTRAERIRLLMQFGVISPNEARKMEGMNPIPGEIGDKHYIPLNMSPAEQNENEDGQDEV